MPINLRLAMAVPSSFAYNRLFYHGTRRDVH